MAPGEWLAGRLGQDAWFCDEFSAADIAFLVTMLCSRWLRGPGPGLEAHPDLARWHERLMARRAVAKAAAEIAAADRALSPPL